MNIYDFNKVVEDQIQKCSGILVGKASEYAAVGEDRLRQFKVVATLANSNPRQAVAGMMIKHTTALYDMLYSDMVFSLDEWDEKIVDHMNYLILLKAVVVEECLDAIPHEINTTINESLPAWERDLLNTPLGVLPTTLPDDALQHSSQFNDLPRLSTVKDY